MIKNVQIRDLCLRNKCLIALWGVIVPSFYLSFTDPMVGTVKNSGQKLAYVYLDFFFFFFFLQFESTTKKLFRLIFMVLMAET